MFRSTVFTTVVGAIFTIFGHGVAAADAPACTLEAVDREPSAMEVACSPLVANKRLTLAARAFAYRIRGYGRAVAGNYPDAIKDYDQALRLTPNDAIIHRQRGYAFMNMGDCANAITSGKTATGLDANEAQAFSLLAQCFQRMGQIDLAVANYSRFIELKPEAVWPRHQRASIALQRGLGDSALADTSVLMAIPRVSLKKLLRVNTLPIRDCLCEFEAWLAVRIQHAQALAWLGRGVEGEAMMNAVVADEPGAPSHFARALFRHYTPQSPGQPSRAAEVLADVREVVRSNPKHYEAQRLLSEVLLSGTTNPSAALESIDAIIELVVERGDFTMNNLPYHYWTRAQALRDLGRTAEATDNAKVALISALQVHPNFAHSVFNRLRGYGYWQEPGMPDVIDTRIDHAAAACMLDKKCW